MSMSMSLWSFEIGGETSVASTNFVLRLFTKTLLGGGIITGRGKVQVNGIRKWSVQGGGIGQVALTTRFLEATKSRVCPCTCVGLEQWSLKLWSVRPVSKSLTLIHLFSSPRTGHYLPRDLKTRLSLNRGWVHGGLKIRSVVNEYLGFT